MKPDDKATLLNSLQYYLEDLIETGVTELPLPQGTISGSTENCMTVLDTPMLPTETLEEIREDLGDCRRCALAEGRKNIVFGTGSPSASLVFVGEAPGRDEDIQGKPFVGEAGQLLTKIIKAMGFSRDDVYICNVLKCRPPYNRNPLQSEIEQCHDFMLRQVKAISPKVIVALGTFAAQTLLNTKAPISRLRGKFHDYHGMALMPTFHPAFLLRNPEKKREVWDDVKQVMSALEK
ncbi:MAG: uracil-DNA glycosylase [Desulfuromonadales bacterium]|nr:uracil-DNA glycosylase [Desulfuromonadales bacterium]